jgi:hypothetical protein
MEEFVQLPGIIDCLCCCFLFLPCQKKYIRGWVSGLCSAVAELSCAMLSLQSRSCELTPPHKHYLWKLVVVYTSDKIGTRVDTEEWVSKREGEGEV